MVSIPYGHPEFAYGVAFTVRGFGHHVPSGAPGSDCLLPVPRLRGKEELD